MQNNQYNVANVLSLSNAIVSALGSHYRYDLTNRCYLDTKAQQIDALRISFNIDSSYSNLAELCNAIKLSQIPKDARTNLLNTIGKMEPKLKQPPSPTKKPGPSRSAPAKRY